MSFSRDNQGRALLGQCLITESLLTQAGASPAYLYDLDAISENARELVTELSTAELSTAQPDTSSLVAYAIKANSAGSILRALREAGTGADIVSGAELQLALRAGFPPRAIVMSGVAKTDEELDLALGAEIHSLQLESVEEIDRVAARARALGTRARVALRFNPGVEIDSHAHIATGHQRAKFGIPASAAAQAWQRVEQYPNELRAVGVSTHVGSMLTNVEPYLRAARTVCDVALGRRAKGSELEYLNFGGGFAIDYGQGPVARPAEFARAVRTLVNDQRLANHQLIVEPGRCLVGPFGALLARVVLAKRMASTPGQRWLFIDAGMNDLLRPALYGAHHRIEALDAPPNGAPWQVAGPVCESADDFGEHVISETPPSHVVIRDVGAYGFTMASSYNGRPLAAEVFLRGGVPVHVNPSPGVNAWVESRLRA